MKKLFALLLSLVLVLGMIPAASAAEREVIDSAEVTGNLPELAVGDMIEEVTMSVPTGANYTVECVWVDYDTAVDPLGTTAAAGKAYELQIRVRAKDGYCFGGIQEAWDMPLLLNGVPAEKRSPISDSINPDVIIEIMIPVRISFKTKIDRVEVSYDEPVAGQPVPVLHLPAGANYVADPLAVSHWHDEDGYPVDTIENGKRYELNVRLFPNDGYEFSEDTVILINGVEDSSSALEVDLIHLSQDHSFLEQIHQVEVTYAELKLGEVLPVVAVPEGANYAVGNSDVWIVIDGEDRQPAAAETKVEKGKRYELNAQLVPAAGYEFDEHAEALVNGEVNGENTYRNPERIMLRYTHSFMEKIDKVELTLSAEPEVGKDAPTVSVPEDANYTINAEETGWFNMANGEKVTGKLEDKKIYDLHVTLEAKEGFEFGGWRDVTLWVNGADVTNGGDYYFDVWGQGTHVYRTVDFCTKIDKAEITYDVPQAGEAVPEVKIPDNANYKLEDAAWYDEYTNEEVTTFENGKSYYLGGVLVAESGYSFSDKAQLLINGEVKEPGEGYGLMGVAIHLYPRVSFKKQITAVDLPDVLPTTLKPGDNTAVKELDAPKDANYNLYLAWGEADYSDGFVEAPDKAPESGTYFGTVMAMPKEGYEFAQDVTVTLGGKAPTGLFLYKTFDQVTYGKVYVLGDAMKLIEKIEVTAEMPVIGKEPGKITVAADAGYEIVDTMWGVSAKDDIDAADEQEGVWAAGDYAWVDVELESKEGYLISSDVEVWVNGAKVELELNENCGYEIVALGFAANLGQLTDKKLSDAAVEEAVKDVTAAKDGDTVTVDMTGKLTGIEATVVPAEVLQAVKDKDVGVVLDADDYSWTINGKDVTAETPKAIDLGVALNTNAIPAETVKKVAGNNQPTMQISLAHEGDFGFTATLKVLVGKEHADKFANLYYHNAKGELEFVQSDKVDKDGYALFNFTHASDYVIVVDNKDHTPSAPATGDSFPMAALVVAALVSAAGIVVLSRKQKKA